MNERAKIPPGLPRPNPTTSYWQQPPHPLATRRSTSVLPPQADYIIIGSGISGASIATHLLNQLANRKTEPTPEGGAPSILLLEARTAASGATGRNGGHTKAASYRSFLDHESSLGTEEAVKIARLEHANILATHALARAESIACDARLRPTVDVVYSAAQFERGKRAIARMREVMRGEEAGEQYRVHGREEARERFGELPGMLGAFEYAAGSISAYAFTVGLLERAVGRGVNLQTSTAVESVESDGREGWIVRTSRGAVTTRRVIMATNGYSAHLLPRLQGVIVPLHGQVVARRPGPAGPKGLEHTYSFIHENGYEYMVSVPASAERRSNTVQEEDDIVIGGGLWRLENAGESRYGETDDSALEPTLTEFMRQAPRSYFGAEIWGAVDADTDSDDRAGVKAEWSGIMGATADGLPLVGPVPGSPGLWISAGFNGHGMVWCLKAAEALVGVLVGGEKERKEVEKWFPRGAWVSEERMGVQFDGRRDLKAPGEEMFGERSNSGL